MQAMLPDPPSRLSHTGFPVAEENAAFRLLNDYQHHFPLLARPFAIIGEATGFSEQEVLSFYQDCLAQGAISRIGALFTPGQLGSSALVAMRVPAPRLEAVANRVSAEAAVNHNYEREHDFNLWFVIGAPTATQLSARIAHLEQETACSATVLPMLASYHIDLGFDLRRAPLPPVRASMHCTTPCQPAPCLSTQQQALVSALQKGLPLTASPFDDLGQSAGLSGNSVIKHIRQWLDDALIRRFGVVVRHHELGINANAMCVWDVPDDQVDALGHELAREPVVTLCYRRQRALPHWRYNLFSMIHGSARAEVETARDSLAQRLNLDRWPHAVLFSKRRFKQTGAHWYSRQENNA